METFFIKKVSIVLRYENEEINGDARPYIKGSRAIVYEIWH